MHLILLANFYYHKRYMSCGRVSYMKKPTVPSNTKYSVIYWTYLLSLICSVWGKQIIDFHLKKKVLKISIE